MPMQYSYSAEHGVIEEVLQDLYEPFTELALEIAAFVPRSLSDFDQEKEQEIKRISDLNPTHTLESTIAYVNKVFEIHASEWWQLARRFSDRIKRQYIQVTLLSHTLCEASINAMLAIGLAEQGIHENFRTLERWSLTKKWREGPRKFCYEYDFPKNTGLFETLSFLVKERNAIVHHKIELEMHGKRIFDGSGGGRIPLLEMVSWMARYFSLPYDLCDRAVFQSKKSFLMGIVGGRGRIQIADAHRADTGPALDGAV